MTRFGKISGLLSVRTGLLIILLFFGCDERISDEKKKIQQLIESAGSGNSRTLKDILAEDPGIFNKMTATQEAQLCEAAIWFNDIFQTLVHHEFLGARSPTAVSTKHQQLRGCLLSGVAAKAYEQVQFLLEIGVSPNQVADLHHTSPLIEAIDTDNLEMAKLLIKHKVNINEPQKQSPAEKLGNMPIISSDSYEMAKLLIDSGADLKFINDRGETITHVATGDRRCYLLRALIESGRADLEHRTPQGKTPLQLAIEYKNTEAIRLLRAAGAKT